MLPPTGGPARHILITGATGYLGRPLAALALARGHSVRAFVRPGSEARVPSGVEIVVGNPLSPDQLTAALSGDDTLVHLIGTPRPSPRKAQQFTDVDLASIRAAAAAAAYVGVRHLVYVSVAQPAPIMQAYVRVRAEGEALVRDSGVPATIFRPWYVLGPGHRWPYALRPIYWAFERVPSKQDAARRLGLITRSEMLAALLAAVERGSVGVEVIDVPGIRRMSTAGGG